MGTSERAKQTKISKVTLADDDWKGCYARETKGTRVSVRERWKGRGMLCKGDDDGGEWLLCKGDKGKGGLL
jgi:hypothetical protein